MPEIDREIHRAEQALREAEETQKGAKRALERVIHFKCPHCAEYAVSDVMDTRPRYEKDDVWRRHKCSWCGKRYTTLEQVVPLEEAG